MHFTLEQGQRLHFIGVSGVGMSALARLALEKGCSVSGSDLEISPFSQALIPLGANLCIGTHRPENVDGTDLVTISTAVPSDNCELQAARSKGIPILHRAEMLALLMQGKQGIAVTGTHGKSTTTALVGRILEEAGSDPTVAVGALAKDWQSNVRIGGGDWFVVEADESDGSFVHLQPRHALITNIELDHVDHFPTLYALKSAFVRFLERVSSDGLVVLNADCPQASSLKQHTKRRCITFSLKGEADYKAEGIESSGLTSKFMVKHGKKVLGRLVLTLSGVHNVANALGALALCHEIGVEFETIAGALQSYQGLSRRFEILHHSEKSVIIDDYAHHPTEVRAVLKAARQVFAGRRLLAVFQPHRYSRTKALWREFGAAFSDADWVCVTDVYAACEAPIEGISGDLIAKAIRQVEPQKEVVYKPSLSGVVALVGNIHLEGDVVLTLGAGDVYKVGVELRQWLH